MLESLPLALFIGTALGFLSALGIGGGSLLMLWLTLVLGWDPDRARGVNLLFFLPPAIFSTWIRSRQGTLALRPILPAALSGCLGAWCTVLLRQRLPPEHLRKPFGILLLIVGIKEILYKKPSPGGRDG